MEFFKLICAILATALYFAAAALSLRHFIHMFQLNSYKPKVQLKWLKDNARGFFAGHIAGVIIALICAVLSLRLPMSSVGQGLLMLLTSAVLLFSAICMRPKPAKIPLKYTARIKRLISTLCIIYLLPAAALIILYDWGFAVVFAAMYVLWVLLSPWAVLLANIINRPVEQAINRHYINDAKRILRDCPNLTVIGITGSFGKTSVKYFLDELLSVKFNVLKTPGNFNTPLGVVKTIRGELRATHDIFLCEMGAKNVGDIKEICDIVHPRHGIITSVGPMHLESFGSIENVGRTKFELADALPSGGHLWLNMDSEDLRPNAAGREYIAYGLDSREGYYVDGLSVSPDGSEFEVVAPSGERCRYKTKLIGRHNAINICGAVAVANTLGIPLEELRPAVRRLESVPHRLELKKSGDVTIIDDAYNSNPTGANAALDTLAQMDGFRILCTPGMIELGERQYELNFALGAHAAGCCDFAVTVGKTNSEAIIAGLKSADFGEEKIFAAESLSEAMNKIYSLTTGGKRKIILLENDLPDNY